MRSSHRIAIACALVVLAGVGFWLIVDPRPDFAASRIFFAPPVGFPARPLQTFNLFSHAVQWGSRALGVVLALLLAVALYRRQKVAGMNARALLFLLAGLVLLPGLLTNTVLKDHWGRARPYQVQEFGGVAHYTRPFIVADQCTENCSFVCGDCAVGFYFHAFGYVAPNARSRRRGFWRGIAFGCLVSVNRLAMGAHFLSDSYFAGLLMLLGAAGLHAILFGLAATVAIWRDFLGIAQLPDKASRKT